jgi:8-oxo-dGTP diphosphatase
VSYTYEYPKADVTTDAVVFGLDMTERKLKVLLIKRGREKEPFYNCWAIPGGFLNMDESTDLCVRRELEEETGLKLAYMEQLYTFSRPDRDPRGRVLTVAYWGIVRPDQVTVKGMDDAKEARWFDVSDLPKLAFDHAEILDVAIKRLRGKLRWAPVGVWLLPKEFTLSEMWTVYETILGRELDKSNFRRKALTHTKAGGPIKPTGKQRKQITGRPAATYTFDAAAYKRLVREGLDFEV